MEYFDFMRILDSIIIKRFWFFIVLNTIIFKYCRHLMWSGTFRLHTASRHQTMGSTCYALTYVTLLAQCSALIVWFSTAMIGTFRSSLFGRVVFLGVRCCVALLLLCFLIVGIQMGTHTSRICIPLSPLVFFGLS